MSKYYTDILLLSPVFLAAMTFAARIWDGVNDPMMGAIVDSTKSRYGKYRRWILIGALSNAVVLVLLFANPGFTVTNGVANVGLCIYVAFTYLMWDITNTMMDIPYWSMVPSLTSDPKERNIAATIPRAFSGMGQLVITIACPLLIPLLGGEEGLNATGFRRVAMLCGVLLIGCILVAFYSTGNIKAVVETKPPEEKITAKAVFQTIKQNDQLLVFMLVALLTNTGWYLVTGLSAYYFEDVVGDLKLLSLFGLLVGAGQAAGLLLLPTLTRWISRNAVIKLAMGMTALGYLGMYCFSALINIFPLFAVFGVIGMIGVGCTFVSQTVMLSDIVDYGEYRFGKRSDSVIFSMKGFLQKGAYSIQALIVFLGLEVSGYQGELAIQPESAQSGISFMMFLLPPLLVLAALLLFTSKYKLDAPRMQEVEAALALNNAQ